MSGVEVIQMLDQTVDWYRTLGAQQAIANEPSDLLILSENRQIGGQVLALAFDVARATAELLGKDSALAPRTDQAGAPSQSLIERQRKLDAQAASVQAEMDTTRGELAAASKKDRAQRQAKLAELQGEIDLINAKRGILDSIAGALSGSESSDTASLRSQIDAMAVASSASAPASTGGPSAGGTAAAHAQTPASTVPASASPDGATHLGLWGELADVFKLQQKSSAIAGVDRRTAALQSELGQIRKRLIDQMRALSSRGDALMAGADNADSATLTAERGELDALATQLKEASVILVPLSKQGALLDQYRRNLKNWRASIGGQSHDALRSLGIRVGLLLLVLAIVFALGEIWHRAVLRYAQDSRRRYQLLLLRKIALWTLVVIIVGSTFASELGSIVTFAGLITAGVAVAMQSVLVSIVGYFFLIGKYGIRVGDRVQIGEVDGEIIELGLVRMYLMEMAGHGSFAPTGRVVAFPNSVVFQVSSGLFKQIPGVSFTWHDITLSVPPGIDYASAKERLFAAANEALADYREEIERQTRELRRTTLSSAGGDALPTVQLTYSTKGVDARVRYPVHLPHAAEIDERMSRALLQVITSLKPEEAGR
jgi:small-conductance mechanosensitive channel